MFLIQTLLASGLNAENFSDCVMQVKSAQQLSRVVGDAAKWSACRKPCKSKISTSIQKVRVRQMIEREIQAFKSILFATSIWPVHTL